jgi:hypothetical protein
MKMILLALVASLALTSPALGQTASRTAPFSEVIAKVELLTAASNATAVANQVRLEMAKGTNKKVTIIKF